MPFITQENTQHTMGSARLRWLLKAKAKTPQVTRAKESMAMVNKVEGDENIQSWGKPKNMFVLLLFFCSLFGENIQSWEFRKVYVYMSVSSCFLGLEEGNITKKSKSCLLCFSKEHNYIICTCELWLVL